jgi:anthranilate phosphoribosyltransferase
MRHAIGPRKELALRTLFNILGPMTNPAGVQRQLIGVFDEALCGPMTEVLHRLGARHVMVVHSEDGLDEISIAAATRVAELKDGVVREYTLTPADLHTETQSLDGLTVSNAAESLAIIETALAGGDAVSDTIGKARAIIAVNAGAAIYVAGLQTDLVAGVRSATAIIASGEAGLRLQQLAALSQSL